jgi:hypothetical protein
MGILQAGSSPGTRVKSGDAVLNRAASVDIKPVKKKVDALRKVNREYSAAHAVTAKAVGALTVCERKIGELDDAQDAAVEAWVAARIGAGEKRTKPLASIGGPSPSDLVRMEASAEARLIKKLAAKDLKHENLAVKRAAAAAIAAADKVLAANGPKVLLVRARDAAIAARDAIGPAWEKAFASLKRGVRSAEDDGAVGLVKALFDAPPRPAKKDKSKPKGSAKGDADTSQPIVAADGA